MNSVNLKYMPTSEILFCLLYEGLNKDEANTVLTKRLYSYGFNEDEVVDLLANEIIKIRKRGNSLNDYFFRHNRVIRELIQIGLRAIKPTGNFELLTVSELCNFKSVFDKLKELYINYEQQLINNGSYSSILKTVQENIEYFDFLSNTLDELAYKEYSPVKGVGAVSWGVKEALIEVKNTTPVYEESVEQYKNLNEFQVLRDQKLLDVYRLRLK